MPAGRTLKCHAVEGFPGTSRRKNVKAVVWDSPNVLYTRHPSRMSDLEWFEISAIKARLLCTNFRLWGIHILVAVEGHITVPRLREGLISGFPMAQIRPLARRRGETAPTDTEFLPLPSSSAATG